MTSARIGEQISSRLAGSLYSLGSEVNIFEGKEYATTNAYWNDVHEQDIQGQIPTAFNGGEVKFEFNKFLDAMIGGCIEVVLNAATFTNPQTTEALVNYFGFRVFTRMAVTLTSSPYAGGFTLPYFNFSTHHLMQNSRQWLGHQEDDMVIAKNAAWRQARLASGGTIRIDLNLGQGLRGFDNCFWLAPLAHTLVLSCTLNTAEKLFYAPGGLNTNITNLNTIINTIKLYANCASVDDDARAAIVNKYEEPDGVFNFVRGCSTYEQTFGPTAASTGIVSMRLEEKKPISMIAVFIECVDKVDTAWQCSPFDIYGPAMTDAAGNTVNMPTHFTLKGGDNVLVKKRSLDLHRNCFYRWVWPDKEPGSYILYIPLSVWDPIKPNAITGAYDPNVYPYLTLEFTYSGALASGGSGAKFTVLTYTPNWIQNQGGEALLLLS